MSRFRASDLRGSARMAVQAAAGVARVVEGVHQSVLGSMGLPGGTEPGRTRGLTGMVYQGIHGVTRLVDQGLQAGLLRIEPLLDRVMTGADTGAPAAEREAVLAALNGVMGDRLAADNNPLAIRMALRRGGRPIDLSSPDALQGVTGQLLLLVHGLCMNDLQWTAGGHDHGAALERDLARTAVQLHYNTGRPLAANGREFARLLERLLKAWPVPVQEVTLLCHSMGGLVARNALDHAFARRLRWSGVPIRAVFLGTPHHGAPLERAGRWAERLIALSPYSAPFARLAKLRSAGIQDLRHGVLDDGGKPLPLPPVVRAYAIASTTLPRAAEDEVNHRLGDGLVPVDSALGRHTDPAFDLRIPRQRCHVAHGVHHFDLLSDAQVYERIARWLRR